MKKDKFIELEIADTIIERPQAFEIDGRLFYLYPVTLGKSLMLARLIESLDIDEKALTQNPFLEALSLCERKREIVTTIIAYHTIKRKQDLFNPRKIRNRCNQLKSVETEDLASLLLMVINTDKTEKFTKYLGIDKENQLKAKVAKFKDENGSTLTFGGKSAYGSLIDFACERYGWSYDYVVWGISYNNLRMIMSDSTSTTYLSEDERKKLRIPKDRTVINADDKRNLARIKQLFKEN